MTEYGTPATSSEELDTLDADAVEDLDVDEGAEDVRGGTTWRTCPTSH